jgi:hypothetical protein
VLPTYNQHAIFGIFSEIHKLIALDFACTAEIEGEKTE